MIESTTDQFVICMSASLATNCTFSTSHIQHSFTMFHNSKAVPKVYSVHSIQFKNIYILFIIIIIINIIIYFYSKLFFLLLYFYYYYYYLFLL